MKLVECSHPTNHNRCPTYYCLYDYMSATLATVGASLTWVASVVCVQSAMKTFTTMYTTRLPTVE